MVRAFELGELTFNPFCLPKFSGPTLQYIYLQLAEEEKQEARAACEQENNEEDSDLDIAPKDTTAAQYVFLLLEVEDQQCIVFKNSNCHALTKKLDTRQLRLDVKNARSPTSKQQANFMERGTHIERQINRVRSLQQVHDPAALQVLATATVDSHGMPVVPSESEDILLMFPSEMPLVQCNPHLASIESCFRDAQCSMALDQLHHSLLKVHLAAAAYRRARFAKLAISCEENVGWRKLEQSDIHMMGDEDEEKKKKQSNEKLKKGGCKGQMGEDSDDEPGESEESEEESDKEMDDEEVE
ncbi:hypothetical protein BT96DRAFT_1009234 [Gymnopus androsaceus JB14]|uniref:Uncharacterized protein n=1 Tax=Gymnopus androsaceus JB14 TaxID=1447944 RepID=A0A6A4GDB4_9AGAR|nr:hypothetical protein BT96DRAFT_1009234 [Gymnopus androsaceus JB14]